MLKILGAVCMLCAERLTILPIGCIIGQKSRFAKSPVLHRCSWLASSLGTKKKCTAILPQLPPPPSIGREQNILTAPIPLTYSLTSTRLCGVPTSLYYESGAPLHSCRGRVCAVGWGHLTQLSPCMSECLQSQTLPLHSVMQTEHRLLHG